MKRWISSFVLLSVPCCVSGWSFTWRNAKGEAFVEHSHKPFNCTEINHDEGEPFRWNPEEDDYSIWLYSNKNCSGTQAGWSPAEIWEKDASVSLYSFRVGPEEDSSSASASSTTTTTTASSSSSSSSSSPSPTTSSDIESTPSPTGLVTSTPTPDNSSPSSSALSGGAIAGIVIGAIAAIAIIGALFFFLGRRRRRSPPADPGPQESASILGGSHPPATASSVTKAELDSATVPSFFHKGEHYEGESDTYKSPWTAEADSHMYREAPTRAVAELPGHDVTVEMSDSHRVAEMDGSANGSVHGERR